MNKIDNLSSEPKQATHIVLTDGTVIDLTLQYNGATERWMFDVVYGEKEIRGNILCAHPNILRQYRNVLPFGLACLVTDGTEPTLQDDFDTGRVELYILDADEAELDYVETDVIGAVI